MPNARVYLKEEMPNDLYYSKNDRIGNWSLTVKAKFLSFILKAPIIVMADEGYTISVS